MIPKKLLFVAIGLIVLTVVGLSNGQQKKKSSNKLKMMMEQKVKDDKEFDEKIARERQVSVYPISFPFSKTFDCFFLHVINYSYL